MLKKNIGLIFITSLLAVNTQAAVINCMDVGTGTSTANFNTGNVTFRGANSDACAGVFSGNDSGSKGTGPSGLQSAFGGTWQLLAKDDNPGMGGTDSGMVAGLDATFSLTESYSGGATSGSWSLSWAGSDLPLEMSIAAVLKAGSFWAGYLFEDELFQVSPASGSGSWEIQFLNKGGNIPDISHFSLYYGNVATPPPPPPPSVAEPAGIALLGLGLFGLYFARRRI